MNRKVVDGNSVRNEERTVSAEGADISRILIVVDCAAKNRTIASPIPEAPPGSVSWAVRDGECRYL